MRLASAVVVLSVGLQGCASFRSGDVQAHPSARAAAAAEQPTVSYDFKFLTRGNENLPATGMMSPVVDKELKLSGIRESHQPTPGQPHVKIVVDNTGPIGAALVTGLFSGLTLTILPGYARDDFQMTAVVTRDGKELKRYEYNDSVTTWIEFFLVFGMPFSDGTQKKVETVMADMSQNLAADLKKDNLLK